MSKATIYFITPLIVILAACNPVVNSESAASAIEESEETSRTETSGSGNGMGMGSSMMERHHATIPEEYTGLSNPIAADEASLERGADIYTTHCAACHGDGGVGDGPASEPLDPAPTNIAHTSQMMEDAYLFYRISEGGAFPPFNSSMIAWKGVLDEEARWDVINYVQALGSGAVTPGQNMGGAAYDAATEAEQRAEMLADAVEQGVINQEEADAFELVHAAIDDHMAEMGDHDMGGMDDMLTTMLSELVGEGKMTQEEANVFSDVHDRLLTAGLME